MELLPAQFFMYYSQKIIVQDGAGRAHSQAAREWKAGVLSIFVREFQTAYGQDPPWMLLDGDFQQHETVLTLNTNGLLPPGSPLLHPATMCAPLRTDRLAAGTTHFSSRPLLVLIAQLSAWIASSSQFAEPGREETLVTLHACDVPEPTCLPASV